ncbi:MAG: golvesin C-terminal-like domain-containing protein [Desulfobulbaceae bacterium]|jgi:hypothetical protein
MMKMISKKWFSLAMALSATVVVSAAAQAQTWDQWIDYGYPGYSETGNTWRTYPYPTAHDGSYRYQSHWDSGVFRYGTATFTTDPLPYTGIYEVRITYRASENRASSAEFVVVKDKFGNLEYHTINQSLGEGMETETLGRYEYKKGQQPYVKLIDNDAYSDSDCVDAAYFKLIEVLPDGGVGPAVDMLLLRER